jgi:hypothetical protein
MTGGLGMAIGFAILFFIKDPIKEKIEKPTDID